MKQTLHDKIYDHPFITIIVSLIIAVVILSPFVWLVIYTNKIDVQRGIEDYNNGICKECGEELEYRGSSRDNYGRYDYYICQNGHIVEVYRGKRDN